MSPLELGRRYAALRCWRFAPGTRLMNPREDGSFDTHRLVWPPYGVAQVHGPMLGCVKKDSLPDLTDMVTRAFAHELFHEVTWGFGHAVEQTRCRDGAVILTLAGRELPEKTFRGQDRLEVALHALEWLEGR